MEEILHHLGEGGRNREAALKAGFLCAHGKRFGGTAEFGLNHKMRCSLARRRRRPRRMFISRFNWCFGFWCSEAGRVPGNRNPGS